MKILNILQRFMTTINLALNRQLHISQPYIHHQLRISIKAYLVNNSQQQTGNNVLITVCEIRSVSLLLKIHLWSLYLVKVHHLYSHPLAYCLGSRKIFWWLKESLENYQSSNDHLLHISTFKSPLPYVLPLAINSPTHHSRKSVILLDTGTIIPMIRPRLHYNIPDDRQYCRMRG